MNLRRRFARSAAMIVTAIAAAATLAGCAQASMTKGGSSDKPSASAASLRPGTPTPSLTPAAGTSQDYNDAIAACLTKDGWSFSEGMDSISYTGPAAQESQFNAAYDTCYQASGAANVAPPKYTQAFLKKKYTEEEKTHACLIKAGYDVGNMPSLQTYSDSILHEGKIYSSYDAIGGVTVPLFKKCGDPVQSWG